MKTIRLILLMLVVCLLVPLASCKSEVPVYHSGQLVSGQLVVTVQDGFTQKPLPGAKVVLAETGQRTYTDEDGRTEPLTLTFPSAALYPAGPDWGAATLLIYCEGYGDTILLNVQVWPDEVRNGPLVLLFGPLSSGDPFVATETPPSQWSRSLMDAFR